MAEKSAYGDEAAAIAAAVARFEAEMAPAAEPPAIVNPWQRAALVEGVGAKETIHDPQGGAGWLS